MATLTVYWNVVTSFTGDVDIRMLSEAAGVTSGAVKRSNVIAEGCQGVYFRSILSDRLDFNAFLSNIKLEDVRRSRNEPDNKLLFRPKQQEEKSIGVLRIVRPKRFGEVSGITTSIEDTKIDRRFKEFEVLLESTEFILEDVQEQMAERFQLQETFGDFSVFFFGKRAEIFTYSGSLLNGCDNLQWRNQFLDNYENFLRGSKCAELKARAYLLYDDVIREGYIISAGIAQNSITEGVVKFNFTLLVTNKRILGKIPTTRKGLITLDTDEHKIEGGIEEFRFVRASDPDLPGVAKSIGKFGSNFPLVDTGLLDTESIPADLEAELRRRSLEAINAADGEIKYADEDTVIEKDVLIDFIPMDEVGKVAKSTSKIISGSPSGDSKNGDGDILATELISGARDVDDLSLKEAILAAEAMTRSRAQEIGSASDKLGLIVEVLRGSQRIIKPPAKISLSDAKLYKESGSVVLSSDNDKKNLLDLIDEMGPIRTLSEKTSDVTAQVINSASARILSLIENEEHREKAGAALGYVATFCLIPKATGGAFITNAQLPNVANLNGLSNALDFVRSQKLDLLADLMKSSGGLPDTVATELQSGVAALRATSLVGLFAAKLGLPKDGVAFGEGFLAFAKSFDVTEYDGAPLSDNAHKFLVGMMTYVTAMLAEKAAASQRMSVDWYGGTVLPSSPEVFQKYFDTSYRDNVLDASAQNKSPGYVVFGGEIPILTTGSGKFIQLPFASLTGTTTVKIADPSNTGTLDIFAVTLGTNEKQIAIVAPSDPYDAIVHKYGYFKITSAQQAQFQNDFKSKVVMFHGFKRDVKAQVDGSKETGAGTVDFLLFKAPIKGFTIGPSASATRAHKLLSSPLGQSYFSPKSDPKKAIFCSIANLTKVYDNVKTSVVSGFSDAVAEANKTFQSIVDSGELPTSEIQRKAINEELAMKRFEDGGDIDNKFVKDVLPVFEALGISVDSYPEFSKMAAVETELLGVLEDLNVELLQAVTNAKSPDSQNAAATARSDKALGEARCG